MFNWYTFEPIKTSEVISFIIISINALMSAIVGLLIWCAAKTSAKVSKETIKLTNMLHKNENRHQLSQAFSNFNTILRCLFLYRNWLEKFQDNPLTKFIFFQIEKPHRKIYELLKTPDAAYIDNTISDLNDIVLLYEKGEEGDRPPFKQMNEYINKTLPRIDKTEQLLKNAIDLTIQELQ